MEKHSDFLECILWHLAHNKSFLKDIRLEINAGIPKSLNIAFCLEGQINTKCSAKAQ